MGRYLNMKYTNNGYGITVPLSQFTKVEGYQERYQYYDVVCQYQYDKGEGKYKLHMWLKRGGPGLYKVDHMDVDTQYVSGDRNTIRSNICRIVEQCVKNGFLNEYIDNYEFWLACFEKGYKFYAAGGNVA